jgi:excinuclease ABC subunit A
MAKKRSKCIPVAKTPARGAREDRGEIVIEGLRQNNLKNLSLGIPHDRVTAVVGVSGSGKSSLAFDTLFAEGRWRFIESLSTYTRLYIERMDRPDVDAIMNIRPAIAVEQKNPVRTSRSTVGTATEVNDYLRLIFARIGRVYCPACSVEVSPSDPATAAAALIERFDGRAALVGFGVRGRGGPPGALRDELLGKGFTRVRLAGGVVDLAGEGLGEPLPPELDVVADRLVIRRGERARLVEAIETSFREGGGRAWAAPDKAERVAFSERPACPGCGAEIDRPTPLSLSFNHPVGACDECKGFGNVLEYDLDKIVPDKTLSLRRGAIEPWTKPAYTRWYEEMERHARGSSLDLDKPFERLTPGERALVFEGNEKFDGVDGFFRHLETKKYRLHIKVFVSRYKGQTGCRLCGGARLKEAALGVRLNGLDIAGVSRMTIDGARAFLGSLSLTPAERAAASEALRQVGLKLDFLHRTGLGYLTLDRLSKTLSGGEAQRVSIATQLASALSGVLYILDEPSIGLHPSDVETLMAQVRRLAGAGNTVVVVEHDPSVIRGADHIVELGPGAGERGGRLVYSGPCREFVSGARTITSDYLAGRRAVHVPRWRRKGRGRIVLKGASGNNLKGVDVSIPLKTLTCVTGVSGSGKSTLVVDTLYNIAARHFGLKAGRPLPYASIEGLDLISGVNLIDQDPIGRTPRSNPCTYMGAFDEIRRAFAATRGARAAGLGPGRFSFNIPGGRCEACKGEGVERLEMYFLPDVYVKCAECGGKRYGRQVLSVRLRGRDIHDCLEMTFDEAAAFFGDMGDLKRRFAVLKDVGLGYLRLGQPATTLSGGEAQRLKIAGELVEGTAGDALYILDEPTTGLHMDDVKRLLSVLGRLVDAGNTVVVIEHNLDCIKTADHIIDLGPGGGVSGGRVVASGDPEYLAGRRGSRLSIYLKAALVQSSP